MSATPGARRYCALPQQPVRLHYSFFDGDKDGETVRLSDGRRRFVSWVGAEDQRAVVRECFAEWKALSLGLDFEEVADRTDAEVRVSPGSSASFTWRLLKGRR